jgi:hypothetical protein
MKKLLLKKSWALILYTILYLYFMVFNWKVFTLKLNINLGFAQVQLPPFIILFIVGLSLLIILTWINYIANLQKIIHELKRGETEKMSDKMVIKKVKEQLKDQENVETLKTRLGISDIRSKQDELIRMISNMQKSMDTKNNST